MKKKYEEPTVEAFWFTLTDVISTSSFLTENPDSDGLEFDFGEM